MPDANITPDPNAPHMGTVTSGEQVHRVRIVCEHWQPREDVNDCRFGCEARSR